MTPLALTPADRAKLEAMGLIKPATVQVNAPRRPLPTHLIAPVPRPRPQCHNQHTVPKRGDLSQAECRANCICIHCRIRPARYYGPVGGYGVGCDECLDDMAAKRRARNGR